MQLGRPIDKFRSETKLPERSVFRFVGLHLGPDNRVASVLRTPESTVILSSEVSERGEYFSPDDIVSHSSACSTSNYSSGNFVNGQDHEKEDHSCTVSYFGTTTILVVLCSYHLAKYETKQSMATSINPKETKAKSHIMFPM
jgi:hypothetical protein